VRELARGNDDRDVDPDGVAKSIGAESTYEEDLRGREAIERSLLAHASRVAQRLLREGMSAQVVTVKLKYADFSQVTRRQTLPEPVCDTDAIFGAAKRLVERVPIDGASFRLTGVSVSDFTDGPPPRSLFVDHDAEKRRAIEGVVRNVSDRFAGMGLTRATLLEGPGKKRD
jgi:DNA polymerase IV